MNQMCEIRNLNGEMETMRNATSGLKRCIESTFSSRKTLIGNRKKVLDSKQRIHKIRAQLAAQRIDNIATLETNGENETTFLESKSNCSVGETSLGQHKETMVMELDKLKSQRYVEV